MGDDYSSRCMCTFCKINKNVAIRIKLRIQKESRGVRIDGRKQAATKRHHDRIRSEILFKQQSFSKI